MSWRNRINETKTPRRADGRGGGGPFVHKRTNEPTNSIVIEGKEGDEQVKPEAAGGGRSLPNRLVSFFLFVRFPPVCVLPVVVEGPLCTARGVPSYASCISLSPLPFPIKKSRKTNRSSLPAKNATHTHMLWHYMSHSHQIQNADAGSGGKGGYCCSCSCSWWWWPWWL